MAHEKAVSWIDKTTWDDGPWQDEPDRIEWRDDATGLPCLARRHRYYGSWCGYVGVPPGHPWYQSEDYDELPIYSAHGGLTFASLCDEGDGEDDVDRVCHVPLPGEPDNVFWLGFDCGHGMDFLPGMDAYYRDKGDPYLAFNGPMRNYRTLEYVRECCTGMALEIAEAAAKPEENPPVPRAESPS